MAKDLISQLLVKDPARRLRSLMGASAIKRHPFFQGVNWALLEMYTSALYSPPFTRRVIKRLRWPEEPLDLERFSAGHVLDGEIGGLDLKNLCVCLWRPCPSHVQCFIWRKKVRLGWQVF
ncbi:hypothetical protein GBA52_027207 [Prunus armeniaca]|nr:hypothetical protein GBA52_027207 [Prunus armeniaca]